MDTSIKQRSPWSRGEKAVLWGIVAALVVGVGWSTWLNYVNGEPVIHLPPTPSMPSPNGFDYFVKAGNQAVDAWPMSGDRPPAANPSAKKTPRVQNPDLGDPKVMAAADRLLWQNRSALVTAEQGLEYMCLAPAPQTKAAHNFAPSLIRIHHVARVAAFQAEIDGKHGDFGRAVRYALLAIRIGAEAPRGGKAIFAEVGWDCESGGRAVLWKIIEALNAKQARHVASVIAAVDGTRFTYADALRENKWGGEAEFSDIFRNPNWKSQFVGQNSNISFEDKLKLDMLGKRRVLDDYDAQMNAAICVAQAPYGAKPMSSMPSVDPISTSFLWVDLGRDETVDYAYNVAQDRLLVIACALRAYELDHHGAYPPTLAVLEPAYLSSVPADPFTASSSLKYKLTGNKYILYSVGPDQRDDGGTALDGGRHGAEADSVGDIVAGVNL